MQSSRQSLRSWLLCFTGLMSLVFGILLTLAPVHADLPPLPDVTPRPTPTPINKPAKEPRARAATLILHVQAVQNGLLSVVQWQDSQGGWHDVESWRGTVMNGKTTWWVERKDFGKGPFRALIYTTQRKKPLKVSRPFHLPNLNQSPLIVDINLPAS